MKKVLIILLALFSLCSAKGQQIKGIVLNNQHKPIPYANILVYNLPDTTFVIGTETQGDGKFEVKVPQYNTYLLRITCLNYQKCQIITKPMDELTITLKEDIVNLQEVVVKSSRPKMRMSDNGIAMQIAGTSLEKIGTTEDLLSYIPSIIKNNNSYEVFGKGIPVFYVNNKKVRSLSELDRLPSSKVESIEVIYQPGAQYNAASPAIIKIITKNEYNGGGMYLRSSYYQADRPSFVEQVDWSYIHKPLELFGSVKYENKKINNKSISSTNILSDTLWNQFLNQEIKLTRSNLDANIGMNYAFSKNQIAGLEYNVVFHPSQRTKGAIYSSILANGHTFDEIQNSVSIDDHQNPEHQLDVFYTGKVGSLIVNFDGTFLTNKKVMSSNYEEISKQMESRNIHTNQIIRNKLIASKLKIQYPIFRGMLSCGAEYIHTKREDNYTNLEKYIPSSGSESKMSNMSIFLEYSNKLPFGVAKAGIRYENEYTDYLDGKTSNSQEYEYRNWFPSISFSSKIQNLSLQIGYTTRTLRPTYTQLSGNVIYGNRFLWQTGNPYLRPEYIHNIFISGLWKFVTFSLNYEHSQNAILYWASPVPQQSAVSCISFINLPSLNSFSASIALSKQIGIWSPQLSVAVKKQWLTLDLEGEKSSLNKPIWQMSFNNIIKFNHSWVLSANGWFISKGNTKNMEYRKNFGAIDIGVTKLLLKDNLSIQLKATDILHSIKNTSTLNAKNINMPQESWTDSRQVILTLSYKINKKQSKFKGSGAGESAIKRL
ncbi:outer membrane beta-barrel family protein [Prevotella veroralis]|uniref:outer membrane beta-barrel family protein n=1 Tax=Prevotella veroralis TaxID=28137 RepID=UPI00037D8E60|nr:outer membrane beta-barrel family protein [Prevotella veroralis]